MHPVFQSFSRSFAILSALFITVISSKVRGHEDCTSDALLKCAKPLSVITDAGLSFVSNKTDLDRICPDLKEAIKCIHTYSRHCMTYDHRRHFKKLFHGTNQMVHNLCKNGTYQQEYLKYSPCMKTVEPQTKVCLTKYSQAIKEIQEKSPETDVSEPDFLTFKKKREAADEGIKNVCCSFKEYVSCSTHTMRNTCGDEAAEFSRRFMDEMSSDMIRIHCQSYGPRECGLLDDSFYSSSNILNMSSYLASVLLAVVYYLR